MSWQMSLVTLWTLLLQTYRWRRGLGRTVVAEAAVAVQSRLAPGSGQCMQLWSFTVCIALATGTAVGWGRQAAAVCF